MESIIIIIAGPAASGKTSLIQRLQTEHPDVISTLPVDHYYLSLDHVPQEKRLSFNFDHPNALEWALLENHLKALLENQKVECPGYCYVTCTRTQDTTTVYPKPIILVDGLLTLAIPSIRQLAHTSIYIDTPIDICLARKLKRDIEERGRTLEQSTAQYLSLTRPMYYAHVLPSRQFADLILPGTSIEKQYTLLEQYLSLSQKTAIG